MLKLYEFKDLSGFYLKKGCYVGSAAETNEAIILGKLNIYELFLEQLGDRPFFVPVKNPYHPTYIAAGLLQESLPTLIYHVATV
ncbi:hypothetical protein [Lentibacillus daqui]|uniref:hypothetical protein n=1 Tax=Lentibacillus daqui TaxID=2911514 RepID=UPI0022B08C94|nr:hypothetical protein [Lentibacillus daqui]